MRTYPYGCHQQRKAIFFILHVFLFFAIILSWQQRSRNHLFSNGRWVAGKDTGKFVFYTYDFLFAPIQDKAINLTGFMGYQEILYREAEGPTRQLQQMTCEASIDPGAYLWIELNRQQERMVGFRLSRHAKYPSGFYIYRDDGSLDQRIFVNTSEALLTDNKTTIQVQRNNNVWTAFVNGKEVGSVRNPGFTSGRLGFRGSGSSHRVVRLSQVDMLWTDPSHDGRSWTERETFSIVTPSSSELGWYFLLATGVIGLRRWASHLLAAWLIENRHTRFWFADDLIMSLTLVTVFLAPKDTHGIVIPTWLLLAELGRLVIWAKLCPRLEAGPRPMSLFAYSIIITLLSSFAVHTHGSWLGRSEMSTKSILEGIHPDAFRWIPEQRFSSPEYTLAKPTDIDVGRPWFVDRGVYREQIIDMLFTMATNTTLDIVFQQQSFVTHGDPNGEMLPLQRRLLRLTTRQDVPWGFASRTGHRPAPWSNLKGSIHSHHTNHLRVVSSGKQLQVTINGETTSVSGISPLGYGATGSLAMDGSAKIHRFSVRPIATHRFTEHARPWTGAALPWGCAITFSLFYAAVKSLYNSFRLGLLAFSPIAIVLWVSLFASSDTLAFMGRYRMAWVDLGFATTLLNLFYGLVLYSDKLKAAPLYGNIILFMIMAVLALTCWDGVLKDDHPLRLKWDQAAVPPAVEADVPSEAPWYAQNKYIGANTWVWRQQLGGEVPSTNRIVGRPRVFVTGGSQSWGSGAASSSETFAELLERESCEVYNAGINGAGLRQLYRTWHGVLKKYEPDILIANIGLNDSAALALVAHPQQVEKQCQQLGKVLQSWMLDCQNDGVQFILVLEPISCESALRPCKQLYNLFLAAAKVTNTPVVRADQRITDLETDELLWWDTAHLTPTGHRRMAAFITPTLRDAIRKKNESNG